MSSFIGHLYFFNFYTNKIIEIFVVFKLKVSTKISKLLEFFLGFITNKKV